jgi:DNA modification methylase
MSHKEDSKKSKGVKDSKDYRPVIGDDKPFDMGLFDWIDCKEQFWWGADYYRETIPKDGAWFVWDKRTEDNFDKMYGNTFELCFSKQVHKRMVLRIRWCGIFGSEQERGSNRVHPTQKPIELCQWFIDKFSQVDGRVFDGFLGSGSTLIACEKTNRKCYGMELDPHYCDVIIKRWEEYTGGKAVLNGRA